MIFFKHKDRKWIHYGIYSFLLFICLFIALSSVSILLNHHLGKLNHKNVLATSTQPCSCYINGFPFIDTNNDGRFNAGENYYTFNNTPLLTFSLYDASGAFIARQTQSTAQTSNPNFFSFNQLNTNITYIVSLDAIPSGYKLTTPKSITVSVGNTCTTGGNTDALCSTASGEIGNVIGLDFGLVRTSSPTITPLPTYPQYINSPIPTGSQHVNTQSTGNKPTVTNMPIAYTNTTQSTPSPTPNPTPIIINETTALLSPSPTPWVAITYPPSKNMDIPSSPTQSTVSTNEAPVYNPSSNPTTLRTTNYSISNPTENANVSGIMEIRLSGEDNATIDLQLEPIDSVIGAIYIGRGFLKNNNGKFYWDSRNSPNGKYKLYAFFTKEGQSQMIVGPVLVNVTNPHASTISQVTFPSQFSPQTVAVDTTKTTITHVENIKTSDDRTALSIHGRSLPNTIITLLIYSSPIVVTVKTDANGFWTYTLEKPLNPGQHTTYAVVTNASGTKIRSEVASFLIAPAFAASSNNENLVLESAKEDTSIMNFLIISSLMIISGIITLAVIYIIKRKTLPA